MVLQRSWLFRSFVVCTIGVLASCGSTGGSTSDPTSPQTSTQTTKVKTTDVLTGSNLAGIAVSASSVTGGTTDSSGNVTLSTSSSGTLFTLSLTGSNTVTRSTLTKIPGNDVTISLIANSFDITSFNQMFRTDFLTRWTSAPPLRVLTNVVEFVNNGGSTFTALAETLTDAEVSSVTSDLTSGLAALSNGTFSGFASTGTVSATVGSSVNLITDGRITYARCHGLTAARGSGGFALWNFQSNGVVTGSMLCVDRDYDLNVGGASTFRKGVRIHELGHALGASHVTTSTSSILNPTIGTNSLTDFDLQAVKVAYNRPPGNRAPDVDPTTFTTNALTTRQGSSPVCAVRR